MNRRNSARKLKMAASKVLVPFESVRFGSQPEEGRESRSGGISVIIWAGLSWRPSPLETIPTFRVYDIRGPPDVSTLRR